MDFIKRTIAEYKNYTRNGQQNIVDIKHSNTFAAALFCHEFSRKTCNWSLYSVNYDKNLLKNHNVFDILDDHSFIAGGAVLDILNENVPNDYDIFFTKIPDLSKYYKYRHTENSNALTIYINRQKIQFIKRIYDNMNQIIGGFDLDSCRFIMNNVGDCYTTYTGLIALILERNYINIACQSSSFHYRMKKYSKKGYSTRHMGLVCNNFKLNEENDYGSYYAKLDVKKLIYYFINQQRDQYFYANMPYSISELLEHAGDRKFIKVLNARYQEICPGFPQILYNERSYCYPRYQVHSAEYYIRQIIKEEYDFYEEIYKFKITNPGSQFTASFNPTNYKFSDFYAETRRTILNQITRTLLAAYYLGIKYEVNHGSIIVRKFPKPIVAMIIKFYFEMTILDYLRKKTKYNKNRNKGGIPYLNAKVYKLF